MKRVFGLEVSTSPRQVDFSLLNKLTASLEYTKKIARFMHSPPKKRILDSTTLPPTKPNPPSAPKPTPIPTVPRTQITHVYPENNLEAKFANIQFQLQRQVEHNICFNSCIYSLETTALNMDSKIDQLLDLFKEGDAKHNKIQQTGDIPQQTTGFPTCNNPIPANGTMRTS